MKTPTLAVIDEGTILACGRIPASGVQQSVQDKQPAESDNDVFEASTSARNIMAGDTDTMTCLISGDSEREVEPMNRLYIRGEFYKRSSLLLWLETCARRGRPLASVKTTLMFSQAELDAIGFVRPVDPFAHRARQYRACVVAASICSASHPVGLILMVTGINLGSSPVIWAGCGLAMPSFFLGAAFWLVADKISSDLKRRRAAHADEAIQGLLGV